MIEMRSEKLYLAPGSRRRPTSSVDGGRARATKGRGSEGNSAPPPGPEWRPTPLRALEDPSVPTRLHFVRNHFAVPALDPGSWSVRLTGSERSFAVGLALLRSLPSRTLSVVLECAGHRRTEFQPAPAGLPWGAGAVAEADWTGVSLASVLELVGIPPEAREVVLEGADAGPVEGFDGSHSFARSLPLGKALHPDVLLAYEMNGEPIPVARGGPIRAVVPGWYATDSVKWLKRIWFVNAQFDGVFQAHDYRLRAPGEPGPGRRMTDLPAHALITTPADGEVVVAGGLWVRGTAWGGTDGIAAVLVRIDGGAWTPARLGSAHGPYTRVDWKAHPTTHPSVRPPAEPDPPAWPDPPAGPDPPAEPDPPAWPTLAPGPHEIACCAIDRAGNRQPERPPANVRGYANNAIHRVRVQAA